MTAILLGHVDEFGVAEDGRFFRGVRGGPVPLITWQRVWTVARARTFTGPAARSPLAGRPYDLRHACVSTWLASGVDPNQVAEWAGHSVDVLLRIYSTVVDGRRQDALQKIEEALGHNRKRPNKAD
ncbi:hypothetical protein [Amycolatopsis benzoatilytica]|uniref:hypothetical protein n=1 Tax=Amycolatopsis benzoatilytica TaxID=346045 RepID=UPI0003649440|nr:hypothetical protein [Amycolatopsis benzoatilytica]